MFYVSWEGINVLALVSCDIVFTDVYIIACPCNFVSCGLWYVPVGALTDRLDTSRAFGV